MARARDIANLINSGTFLTPASASATYTTKTENAITPIIPNSISVSSGSYSISGNTIIFSGVSSISLDGLFSSTYNDYMIVANNMASTTFGIDVRFNFRLNNTDDTTANYSYGRNYLDPGAQGFATGGGSNLGNATFGIAAHIGSSPSSLEMTIGNPFFSAQTSLFGRSISLGGYGYLTEQYTAHKSSTSFTGIKFYIASGTMGGKIKIYGYKD